MLQEKHQKTKVDANVGNVENCDAPNNEGSVDNSSTRGNLRILGAPISHSHVSYIKTHSCIFNSQYTKIYDRL